MNVTTAGVKGYEFQYKVTILLGLLNLPKATQLFAEKKGSEDALIEILEDGVSSAIEVQIKNSSSPIDVALLTKWLCHFQELSATENLLSRLSKTTNRALIVTTARCQDPTSSFIKKIPGIDVHTNLKIDTGWAKSFVDSLSNNEYTGTTKLQTGRDQFCKTQAVTFTNPADIERTLNKLVIWEQVSESQLDETINIILNTSFQIPQSITFACYLELLESVKSGRDSKTDILPAFRQILSAKKGDAPRLNANYVRRKEEAVLIEQLESTGLLLLTGRTQCGKTELAKKVTENFYYKGFSYRICNDLVSLDNFLNLNAHEDKICILEDPWGHIEPGSDAVGALHNLKALIENKKPNHKLIVTTRGEVLNALIFGEISRNKIANTSWTNITATERRFLIEYWQNIATAKSLQENIIKLITDELNTAPEDSLLQMGELKYLVSYDQNLQGKSTADLIHIARQSSAEIGLDLLAKHAETADILAAICTCADTITFLELHTLFYILSNDETEPGILEDPTFSSGGGFEPDSYPSYEIEYKITEEWQQHLEYLERRSLITVRENKIWLAHPNFVEAGKKLLFSKSSFHQTRLLNYIRKAITCLSPENAAISIKLFDFLLQFIEGPVKEMIFDLALLSLKSIYPSIRDQALVFLVARIRELPLHLKKKVEGVLDYRDISTEHIYWHGDTPYISTHSTSTIMERLFKLPKNDFNLISEKLNNDQSVSPSEAWNYIRTVQNSQEIILTEHEVNNLLSYNELFIRKATVKITISRMYNDPKTGLINLIFSDGHPSVVFVAIQTILAQWKWWPDAIKQFLSEKVKAALTIEANAIRSNQFLTTFEKTHTLESVFWDGYNGSEKAELWNLWAELYIITVVKLPADLFMNATGFGETVDTAFKYLTRPNGMAVLDTWYNRIDYKIGTGLTLDEYELAIADVLMYFTDTDASARKDLFNKLLGHKDTGFIISSLKWIMSHWGKLVKDEKDSIINLTKSPRTDIRWIKATMITRHSVPPEIQQELFANSKFFDLAPEDFVKNILPELLHDSLKMYFGHPQPLWWFAMQYNHTEFWDKIVVYVLENSIEPFFSTCLRNLTFWGVLSSKWHHINILKTWNIVCQTSMDKNKVSEQFIFSVSSGNCSLHRAKAMFVILIKAFIDTGDEDVLLQMVIDKIEMLQQTGHGPEDLFEIIPEAFLIRVLNGLSPDVELHKNYQLLKTNPGQTEELKNCIQNSIKNSQTIRFEMTENILKEGLKELAMLELFETDISKISYYSNNTGEQELEKRKAIDNYTLLDWNGNH